MILRFRRGRTRMNHLADFIRVYICVYWISRDVFRHVANPYDTSRSFIQKHTTLQMRIKRHFYFCIDVHSRLYKPSGRAASTRETLRCTARSRRIAKYFIRRVQRIFYKNIHTHTYVRGPFFETDLRLSRLFFICKRCMRTRQYFFPGERFTVRPSANGVRNLVRKSGHLCSSNFTLSVRSKP